MIMIMLDNYEDKNKYILIFILESNKFSLVQH